MSTSTSSNVVKLAPYFTAQLLLVPGAFATHMETYMQYANSKGADALWLQETLDPMLIETLEARCHTARLIEIISEQRDDVRARKSRFRL